MSTQTHHALTDAQAAQFERDGYVILHGLFTPQEVEEIKAGFMAQAQNGPVEGLSDFKFDGVLYYDAGDPLAFYPRMMQPHTHPELPVGPLARRYLLDARLGAALAEIMGDEPVAVQSMFYFKPPGARGQELHQDNFYLRVAPGTCYAAWVAVDDVDAENGGMKVVPGSNHMAIACPQKADSATSFTPDYVPVPEGMEAVHADMKAGDVLFFNGSLIHGSTPNTSADRFRRSIIFHYVPRNTQELAHWYEQPTTFAGEVLSIKFAEGGGPCGVAQPIGMH